MSPPIPKPISSPGARDGLSPTPLPLRLLVDVLTGVLEFLARCTDIRRLPVSGRSTPPHARPLSIAFQYSAGSPYFLSSHMSLRSLVVSISGIDGAGCIV